jgi:hypothetical protein
MFRLSQRIPLTLGKFSRNVHVLPWIDRLEDEVYVKEHKKNQFPTVADEANEESKTWTSVVDENNNNAFLLKVMRAAKKRKDSDPASTLIKRLPGSSPNTLRTDGEIQKLLHYERITKVRQYLREQKLTTAIAHERAYRDLDLLDLSLPKGTEEWKVDVLNGFRNELAKQPYWTTGQKERFLLEAKRRFTEDYTEANGYGTWKWLVQDTENAREQWRMKEEREARRASDKRTTRRKKLKDHADS